MELSKRAERRDKESFRKMLVQREQPKGAAKSKRGTRPARAARPKAAAAESDSGDDMDDSDDDQARCRSCECAGVPSHVHSCHYCAPRSSHRPQRSLCRAARY